MSRRLLALLAVAVVAASCSAAPDLVVTEDAPGAGVAESSPVEEPTATSTPVPGTAPATPDADAVEPTSTPDVVDPSDPSSLLLTENDLPGWAYGRAMAVAAEPTFDADECDPMNQAWAAHALPGTRVRATADTVSLRQTVVRMPDADAAAAVLDAAFLVWQDCVVVDVNGESWWVEPVQVPDAGRWRSTAIAIGLADSSVWIIGYWQLEDIVVFVDIDGERPWNTSELIFDAIAGRLQGTPAPAPAPTPDVPELTQPTPTPEPAPTVTPRPTPGPVWRDDPLAALLLDPDDIGPGWLLDSGQIVEPEPGGGFDIEGCDVPTPVTPRGVEVRLDRDDDDITDLELVVLSGTPDEVATWPEAFRGLGTCDLTEEGFVEATVIEPAIAGADDSVVLDAELAIPIAFSEGEGETARAVFAFATYGGLGFGLYWVGPDIADAPTSPTVERALELLELMASKR